MEDKSYCYPGTNILKNKLDICNKEELFEAEKELTFIRLQEMQDNPVDGKYDFDHLKKIHEYIFQDIYDWAGKIRTVEIGKGNLFCTTSCIQSYATSVFHNYYAQCFENRKSREEFLNVFADNYADLNALHPFREGNGRAQREFARLICRRCGYVFDLSIVEDSNHYDYYSYDEDNKMIEHYTNIYEEKISKLQRKSSN
jgi:cell filamentation protein